MQSCRSGKHQTISPEHRSAHCNDQSSVQIEHVQPPAIVGMIDLNMLGSVRYDRAEHASLSLG